MNEVVVSIIRTVVPAAVGGLLTWLATRLDIVDLDTAGATETVTVIVVAAYYSLARWLEQRGNEKVGGTMLGARRPPTYNVGDNEIVL